MGEFFAFVLIVFSAVWGSIFLGNALRRGNREYEASLGSPDDDPRLARLIEDNEILERRLAMVEDELRFFRELRAPEDSTRLPSATPPSDPS